MYKNCSVRVTELMYRCRDKIVLIREFFNESIDCLFTCFLFCFIGFCNGIEKTRFVMIQGICGAFLVRIPIAFLMQQIGQGSLFKIGLATPCSTVLQIVMCFAVYVRFKRNINAAEKA